MSRGYGDKGAAPKSPRGLPPCPHIRGSLGSPQNSSRSANWIWRSRFAVSVMAPADPAYFVGSEVSNTTFPAIGLLKFAWFRMLKASALNCKFNLSFRGIRLNNDMSRFQNPGPVNLPRDTLPKVPVAGNRKALGSKYRPVFLNPSTPRITFPLKAGFTRGTSGIRESPFPDWLTPTTGVMGKPLWALKMPFHCQLPISLSTNPVAPLPKARPLPNGSW